MPGSQDLIAIGEMARRSGTAASALRFYETRGLIHSERSAGGHRLYRRNVLRRVAFIRIAQRVGLTLEEISEALSLLPPDRAPTKAEWARLSRAWHGRIEDQIRLLEGLRDDLTSCIGCGCLSLQRCGLSNPRDIAARLGAGPRYLLGDSPPDAPADQAGRMPPVPEPAGRRARAEPGAPAGVGGSPPAGAAVRS